MLYLKKASAEIWPKCSEEETTQKKTYQDEDQKSAINKIHSQIKKPHLKMIPIKDNYKFGTDPIMEDQIKRTNNWIYKTKKSNLDRPSGPVAQRIEALSLYSSRIAVSIPTQASQRFTWSKMWCNRQVITGDTVTSLSISI